VALLTSFGFTERSLTSANSILPIAYYLLKRGLPTSYDSSKKYSSDRAAVHQWLLKSLLRGAFGAHGDTVLSSMRSVIKASNRAFPSEALTDKVQKVNRRFTDEDIDDLLGTCYGQKQAFLVLSLLYPWVDYRNAFHLDHIHPQSAFTPKRLRQLGLADADVEFCLAHYNEIPNLQILASIPNIEKSSLPFEKWLAEQYPGKKAKAEFCDRQFIPDTGLEIANFRDFFDCRTVLMKADLRKVLQSPSAAAESA
jgi:hypothetical protein